jgi:plastocyanin
MALAVPLVAAAPAGAVSRKVAIGDFQWSPRTVSVDLGDTVTWYWIGPDTQHSVTGLSANAAGIDSDPGSGAPDHAAGDRFTARFDQPGTYELHCKLHAIVRGTVVVSDAPGTGAPSPDPEPQLAADFDPPELTEVRWAGPLLRYTLDERARIVLDVMKPRRGVDRLVTTRRFRGHIGWNEWRFDAKLRPGRYYALLVATDAANNHTRDVRVPLVIRRSSASRRRTPGRRGPARAGRSSTP